MGIKFDCNFFVIPHLVVDTGLLNQMTGSEAKLYLVLCKLSNRFSRITVFHSDEQLMILTGIKDHKTLTRAKKGLKRLDLIDYRKKPGLRTDYTLIVAESEDIGDDHIPPTSEWAG